ncbi:MAG TPA: orotidine-5'-phosphate decarboxylase [Blastocatellia bacterium]|jgi:orotidine-5'-phosphate decarboxylase|nr:orotidine-5'-phosphate decarboxylase [Blastocatellia bacterium]HAF22304.1 orotidine-5'-phosphate decarboxylase [Blastocatellia bacterium]HCX29367.1 orotidine-5'-phosphate decarboxylase [Blastocatellia bacterium]
MKTNKLIVALDVETAPEALKLVSELRGIAGMFKVGMQLFTSAGPTLVREIISSGERVFLDLKYHDIPNTVALAGVEATRLGVSIFNIHASGGGEMMRRTADAVARCADAEGLARPSIIAVTVLTSANANTLGELGGTSSAKDLVGRLALLAEASGMDGVVASPREVGVVRAAVKKPGFIVVTPGVRPAGAGLDDQKRVATPREATLAGADYVVVGRPILGASNPAQAAQEIIEEMEINSATSAA